MKLILASKSPRRKEIIEKLGVHPEILALDTPEDGERDTLTPAELVEMLARRKAEAAWSVVGARPDADGCVVLSADTVVAFGNTVLEKPKDGEDARHMLSMLSGNRHEVFTGFAAVYRGKTVSDVERTDVFFRELSAEDIDAYVRTGEPMDKAGAYAAQGRGSLFVRRIEGDYFNVVGLPAGVVNDLLLKSFGTALPDFE